MSKIWDAVAEVADEIAIEMYNKEWKDLPNDNKDECMEIAENKILGT